MTLRSILESKTIPKVFIEVRNDPDALLAYVGIRLPGAQDVQLMELATRTLTKRYVNRLSRCIERDPPMTLVEKAAWKAVRGRES